MTVEEGQTTTETPNDIIPDRIFVGNLPYDVTEDDVRNLTPEFDVVSVEIPRKNFFNRELGDFVIQSKGYGFITYTNANDAKVAIDSIVGKCISGREIYAKYALPQNKSKLRERYHNNSTNTHNTRHHQGAPLNYPKYGTGYIINGVPMHQIYPPPPPPPGTHPYNNGANTTGANGAAPPLFYQPGTPPFYSFNNNKNGGYSQQPPPPQHAIGNGKVESDDVGASEEGVPSENFSPPKMKNVQPFFPQPPMIPVYGYNQFMVRREEKQRRLANGVPSKLTVFVGNLERNVTVDVLKEFMKEANPVWIKVPRQSYPAHVYRYMRENGETIQNKGIAFINFETHEAQEKAIELFDGKELRGKRLNVTVAINSNDDSPNDDLPNDELKASAEDFEDQVYEEDDTDVEVVLESTAS